jgi:hypothetical protein
MKFLKFCKNIVYTWIEFTQETVSAVRKAKAERMK